MESDTRPPDRAHVRRNSLLVLALTGVALVPMLAPDFFSPGPDRGRFSDLAGQALSLLIPAAAILACWRILRPLGRTRTIASGILLCALVAALETEVHVSTVDYGSYFRNQTNLEWQSGVHEATLQRDPGAIPHSYRFLPSSFTRWIEWFSGSYPFARTIYRGTFTFLLLCSIYRFARFYADHTGALTTVLLCGLVYPITIRIYAGQLADPMSHLSFVLAFIALESGVFSYFLLAVALGCLAKEAVLAMLGFFWLFYRKTSIYSPKRMLLASIVCLGVVVGARLSVRGPVFEFSAISGVGLDHVVTNLRSYPLWIRQTLFSFGLFAPFVVLGWSSAPSNLRHLILFLTPILLLSGTLFSWLHEARNYVPLVVPMAIVSSGYLLARLPGGRAGEE